MTFDLIGIGPKGRFSAENVIFGTGAYEINRVFSNTRFMTK
jgi:hypothetical protein